MPFHRSHKVVTCKIFVWGKKSMSCQLFSKKKMKSVQEITPWGWVSLVSFFFVVLSYPNESWKCH